MEFVIAVGDFKGDAAPPPDVLNCSMGGTCGLGDIIGDLSLPVLTEGV